MLKITEQVFEEMKKARAELEQSLCAYDGNITQLQQERKATLEDFEKLNKAINTLGETMKIEVSNEGWQTSYAPLRQEGIKC